MSESYNHTSNTEIKNAGIFEENFELGYFETTDCAKYSVCQGTIIYSSSQIVCIFVKDKYFVGHIEPQRIHLTSDLSIPLRAYRTSSIEEKIRIGFKICYRQDLLKKSYYPYSSHVTLVYKREGKKIHLCVDFRKLNVITKTDTESLEQFHMMSQNRPLEVKRSLNGSCDW